MARRTLLMLIRVVSFAALASVMVPAAAQAFERVIDLPFGEALDRRFLTCRDPDHDQADYCARSSPYIRPAGAMMLELLPPEKTSRPIPTWIKRVVVKMDELANVTQLLMSTSGVGDQPRVLAALEVRFGPPEKKLVRQLSTLAGVSVEVTRAQWVLPGGFVYHNCTRLDECSVWVMTPKAYARFLQEDERLQERNKF